MLEGKEDNKPVRRALVMHPLLFALWPILFFYSRNLEYVPLSQAWTSSLVLVSITFILLLLFTAVLRNVMKAGAIVSLFLLLFFSYGHVYSLLWRDGASYAPTTGSLVLMIAWAMIFAGGSALVLRANGRWQEITRALNVVALTLVVISAFNIGVYEIGERISRRDVAIENLESWQAESLPVGTLPNIYYIVLDAYGRADTLEEVYNYDNSEFQDFLTEQGFYIAGESRANYAHTDLSLASSLNLNYLDDLASQVDSEARDRRPLEDLIQRSAVVQFLKEHGYTIVALPSGYSTTDLKSSDVHVSSGRTWNELEIRLLCSTPIPWLAIRGSVFDPYTAHRQKILYPLNHIADSSDLPGPQFVFSHILAPHGPFVFDEHGNEIDPQRQFDLRDGIQYDEQGQILDEFVQGYTGQLAFINSKIQPVIEDLIAQSSRPTIVILQSDHGPGAPFAFEDPGSDLLKERLAILNAYLLPGEVYDNLYQDITPVNTFRLIFNQYLGTDLEILKDESYYSTRARPYLFINVTDEVLSDGGSQPAE